MTLETREQVENTRAKLREVEALYRDYAEAPGKPTSAARLTMRSLKRLINQLTEEIIRYEGREEAPKAGHESV